MTVCPHTQTPRVMCSASCCEHPIVPFIADEGRDGINIAHLIEVSDPGDFADALRFVNFQVLDHRSDRFPDRDGSAAAVSESVVPFFHDNEVGHD